MSALPSKADIAQVEENVRFVPKGDKAQCSKKDDLFDQLVRSGDRHREMAKLDALMILRFIGTRIFKKKRRLAKQTVASLSTSKL